MTDCSPYLGRREARARGQAEDSRAKVAEESRDVLSSFVVPLNHILHLEEETKAQKLLNALL